MTLALENPTTAQSVDRRAEYRKAVSFPHSPSPQTWDQPGPLQQRRSLVFRIHARQQETTRLGFVPDCSEVDTAIQAMRKIVLNCMDSTKVDEFRLEQVAGGGSDLLVLRICLLGATREDRAELDDQLTDYLSASPSQLVRKRVTFGIR